ncbi:MAG: hypothetical protein KJ844_11315 [Candidatus Edwardsbacteria bacterium]|nr:hypothetical protein [Pseudomonadota bacterium]MBU2464660.1 hypothetical protein [Candidatus Edwardsbacteria bacterium]
MGGINHQPTKKMFEFSTMLSQYFTGSIAKLMLANCHLEDALLAELSCSPSARVAFFMDRAKLEISDSARLLENSINALDQLANQMKEIEYADTSRSTVSDYERLGSELVQNSLIPFNPQSWEIVSKVRHEESFFGICELFRERFRDIIATIHEVEVMFDLAKEYAERGNLVAAIDENGLPFRPSFFKLLTKLTETLVMFAHSSAMSTEMYYREEGYGSLLSEQRVSIAA